MDTKKCALITGAVRNTGLAIAKRFLEEGWTVFITSRDENEAEKTASDLTKKYGIPCFGFGYSPLNAKEDVHRLFSKIEKTGHTVNTVVCAAADLGLAQNSLECDPEAWANVFFTNITGYFAPAQAAAVKMINAKCTDDATIVFIGSINYRDAIPNRSAYVSSKGGILSMTKAMAIDLAKYGIRVNCVMPGPIWTTRYDADPDKAKRKSEPIPLGRVSSVSEIAQAVFYLSSANSGNMTGSGIIIDGGLDSICADYKAYNSNQNLRHI